MNMSVEIQSITPDSVQFTTVSVSDLDALEVAARTTKDVEIANVLESSDTVPSKAENFLAVYLNKLKGPTTRSPDRSPFIEILFTGVLGFIGILLASVTGYWYLGKDFTSKHGAAVIFLTGALAATAGYDADNRKIVTRAVGNVKERVGKELECGQRGFVDPDNRMIAMLLYEGLVKIVPIEANGLRESFNVSLEESIILDVAFLYGCSRPTICVLYQDQRKSRHVKTFVVDSKDKELAAGPWTQSNLDYGTSMIITVPNPLNGIIVIGSTSITYVSGTGNVKSVEVPITQFSSYSRIDANGTRYLLGDHRGNLMVLVLQVDRSGKVTSLLTDIIGVTSVATTLNYLDNGVVFVGSAFGDSQLIKLHEHSSSAAGDASDTNLVNSIDAHAQVTSNAFDVLDVYPNIGPIVDMCLVDNDKQGGQRQLVTCSGAYKDGSLRIVRSGIGIQEQASLEVPGIQGMWSLKPSDESAFDKYLVQSFIGETRILAIEEEELAEFEIEGFNAQLPTLYCGNMVGSTLVQVTPSSVRLIDAVSFQLLFEYVAEKTITVASGNAVQVAIAMTGGALQYLEMESVTQRTLRVVASTNLDQDVACVSLRPFSTSATGTASKSADAMDVDTESSDYHAGATAGGDLSAFKSSIISVAMWTDNSVRLLALPTLEEVCRVQLGTETQARNILMVELNGRVFVMVGLGDGHLITYNLDMKRQGELPTLTNKRKGVLGTHAISFDCFENQGETCVFASCDRPTVIYARNGKLLFSVINVTHAEITRMTPFHSQMFPHCLAMSSESSLMIGVIEDIQKVHIQTVPLGESPRRIAFNSSVDAYGVCTEKTITTNLGDETTSRVLFLDGGTLETIGSFELDRLESVLSIISGSFHCSTAEMDVDGVSSGKNSASGVSAIGGGTSSSNNNSSVEYFIVGTARVIPDELEPSKGRLLILEVTPDRKICLANEKEVPGAAFSLAMVEGKLAVGVSSKVMLFDWLTRDGRSVTNDIVSQPELQLLCTRQGFIMSLFLKAYGDKLVVGDIVRSMSVLRLSSDGKNLDEIARDFNTVHLLAVEALPGGEHFLGCDDFGNFTVLRQQTDAISDEERSKLEVFGEFSLGDFVNVFRRGTLVGQPIENEYAGNGGGGGSGGGGFNGGGGSGGDSSESGRVGSSSSEGGLASTFGVSSTILSSNYQSVTGYSTQSGDHSVLYGTIGGAVGSVMALREDSYHFFNSLEKSMIRIMNPVGGLTHSEWRNCSNTVRSSPQKNIVDGNVVEMFLDLSSEEQEQVTRYLNEDLNNYIVQLQEKNAEKKVKVDSSASVSVLLQNLANDKVELTVEDVVRRVEDISRLH